MKEKTYILKSQSVNEDGNELFRGYLYYKNKGGVFTKTLGLCILDEHFLESLNFTP